MKHQTHTEADRAVWLIYVVQYTAEGIGKSISETIELLNEHGFIEKTLKGYPAFHTQGFEYMAEFLMGELQKAQGVLLRRNQPGRLTTRV